MTIFRNLKLFLHRFFLNDNDFIDEQASTVSNNIKKNFEIAKPIGINRDVNLIVTFEDVPYFFIAIYSGADSHLILNGHHPVYSALSLNDEKHPLLYFLTTWVKLGVTNNSKQCNDLMSVAKKIWENELDKLHIYQLNYEFKCLPSFTLFESGYVNGEVRLIINRNHIFYIHYISCCNDILKNEFLLVLMAWCIAESKILSQVNLKKMINAREMLNTFLYTLVDDSLDKLEVNNAK